MSFPPDPTSPPEERAGPQPSEGGAHIQGDVTGGTVTQIGRDQINVQLPRGVPLPRGGVRAAMTGQWLVWPAQGERVSNLRAHNPRFVDRQDLLADLASDLDRRHRVSVLPARALHGLGGVGKTELALEYAHRHADQFQVIWWVDAEQPLTIPAQLAQLADRLGLPQAAEVEAMVVELLGVLAVRGGWLVVFDNATTPGELTKYWPDTGRGGRILVTSRNPAWGALADPIEVDTLSQNEAAGFVLARTHAQDAAAAEELAGELGGLPLALEQAAGYIEATGTSLGGYLAHLQDQQAGLLGKGELTFYQRTVQATFQLAFDQAAHADPVAADLLVVCALLAPDPIPLTLFATPSEGLLDPLAAAVEGGRVDELVGVLRRLSLVKRDGDRLLVHRLIQQVTRDRLDDQATRRWAGSVVQLLKAGFPEDSQDGRTWPVCQQLLPHALAVAEHTERLGVEAEATGWLLDRAATYLQARGQFADARALFERSLVIYEAALGRNDPGVAASRNNLSGVLLAMGDFTGAHTQLEQALPVLEATMGPKHPDVAHIRNNLGLVLQAMGDLAGARAQLERTLAIYVAVVGPDHPALATWRSNLGSVLQAQGDLVGARAQLERALASSEAAVGPNHPEIAVTRSYLGSVLQAQGDLVGARAQFERALASSEAVLGPNHPTTMTVRSNLVGVQRELGET